MFLFVLADKARSGDLIARESVKIRDDVYNNIGFKVKCFCLF